VHRDSPRSRQPQAPPRQHPCHVICNLGSLRDHLLKRLFAQSITFAFIDGNHGCSTCLAGKQTHLSEELATAELRDFPFDVVAAHTNTDGPGLNDIEPVGFSTLASQNLAGR